MSLTNLSVTDTFRIWFNRMNDLINLLNTGAVVDGAVVYGVFELGHNTNTSFDMIGSLLVNSTSVNVASALVAHGNTTFTTDIDVFNDAAKLTLLQSDQGTIINASPFTVNSNALFLAAVTISNNVGLTGNLSITGNFSASANAAVSGPLSVRQILFGQTGAMISPADLSSASYNDYNPTGLDTCAIINLNPTNDAVLTGLLAPTAPAAGGTFKYIQNINATYKVSLASANGSSSAFNQFKTPGDALVDILPGGAVMLLWTTANKQWRVTGGGPSGSLTNAVLAGNTNTTGNLSVTNLSTFLGNSTFGALTLFVDSTNNRIGIKHAAPTDPLTVNGNVAIVGTFVQSGLHTINGNTIINANTTVNGVVSFSTVGNNTTFGNTITVASVSQSFISNFKANTLISDISATLANVSSSGKAALSGTLVIPVGSNKWAV